MQLSYPRNLQMAAAVRATYQPGQQLKESAAYPALEKVALVPLSQAIKTQSVVTSSSCGDGSLAPSSASSRTSSPTWPRMDSKDALKVQWDDQGSECSTVDTQVQGCSLHKEGVEATFDGLQGHFMVDGMRGDIRTDEGASEDTFAKQTSTVAMPANASSGLVRLMDVLADKLSQRPPVHAGTNIASPASPVPPPGLVLRLEHALMQDASEENRQPEWGSGMEDELPSIGSADHILGKCKPCAFFHSKGCESGADCRFCHLCGSSERRQRRKARKQLIRSVRQERRQRLNL